MEEKEITTLVEYNEMEFTLQDLATRAQACTEPNKEIQRELQKTRVRIEKIGKFLREDFTRKGKEVIAKEKELIGIIQPHEERLKRLVEQEELSKQVEYRKTQFDARSERLATLGVSIEPSQSETMDDLTFEQFYMATVIEINTKKQADLLAREAKLREAEEAQKREAEMKEREDKARKDAEAKAERDIADANARAERAEQDAKDRLRTEEILKKDLELAEKKRLEADTMYNLWLEKNGCTKNDLEEGDFRVFRGPNSIELYKFIDMLEIV